MTMNSRVYAPIADSNLRDAVARATGCDVRAEFPTDPAPGDLVVLDATAGLQVGGSDSVLGNAFSACRAIKREPRTRVFVVIASDDPFGEEIARFCMADGVLRRAGEGLVGLERLAGPGGPSDRTRPPVDDLLDRYETRLQDDPERAASALERIAAEADSDSVTARFTDAETGLYDGAFAGFKLDEELKRAVRFHHPLSLLLLDCGVAQWPRDDGLRRTILAEIAGIFLEECRDIDVLARFTETVFLFLLPGTGPDGAAVVAGRMVESLTAREFSGDVTLQPSIGIATAPHPEVPDRRAFLGRAEAAMERARRDPSRVAVAAPG